VGRATQERDLGMADRKTKPLTESDLEEIERLARQEASETYRGVLLALVDEVRRLRRIVIGREVTNGK
jgi:hypothetical protein